MSAGIVSPRHVIIVIVIIVAAVAIMAIVTAAELLWRWGIPARTMRRILDVMETPAVMRLWPLLSDSDSHSAPDSVTRLVVEFWFSADYPSG